MTVPVKRIFYHNLATKSSSATVAQWVTHLSKNSEDVGSNPSIGKYIVARMTT